MSRVRAPSSPPGASRTTVQGAGHEIQFTGPPLNEVLLDLWRTTPQH